MRQGKSSVLGFLKNIFIGESVVAASPVNKRKVKLIGVATFCSLAIIILLVIPTNAQSTIEKTGAVAVEWIVAILAKILTYIAQMLSFLLLQLVDFLIQIVQYNNFVKAAPVRIGWPLIRDTVNMFFIIVVLVSAFATIIGYPKEFHYKGILPKLLLMAVLINFSKTLIGLMIDFSQVLVLTFVNGFKEAAGGNFANALHIREAMSIDSTSGNAIVKDETTGVITVAGDGKVDIYQIFNMLLAAIFAVWILSLSLTLIIIMVVFFLARIIVLWFLLITSPVMFFAWSLPGKLQKSFSAFTDQWWNRLSTALIGGPTMAFFLWISLAMAQASNGPDRLTGAGESSLYKGPNKEVQTNIEGLRKTEELGDVVVTKIGSSENLANFIIMIAFMLLGVQVAVQQSNALAPKLGSLAGAIGGAGGMMGIGVAGTYAAAKLAERGAKAGVSKTAGYVNDKYAISNRMAGAIGRSSIPMTYNARKSLMQHAAIPRQKAEAMSSEMQKALAHEDPLAQRKILENWSKSGNRSRSEGAKMALVSLSGNTFFAKKLQKSYEDDAKKEVMAGVKAKYGMEYDKLGDAQKKEVDQQVQARARAFADRDIAAMQDKAKEFAEATNNNDLIDKLHKMRVEDPSKQQSLKDVDSVVAKVMSDEDGYTKFKDDAYMDSATFLMVMKHKNWMDKDGNLTVSENDKDFKRFMVGKQGQHAKAHIDYIQNSPEGRKRAQVLLNPDSEEKDIKAARYHLVGSKDGKGYGLVDADGKSSYLKMGGRADNAKEILENVTDDASDLRTALNAYGGGKIDVKDIGVRLNNDKMKGLTANLNTISAKGASDVDRRAAMGNIIANNEMRIEAMFDINKDGDIGRNKDDFSALMKSSLQGVKTASTPAEAAKHINVLSSMADAAKASGGQALTEFQKAVQADLLGYKKVYDGASAAQRSSIGGAVRKIGSEAEIAEAKQKSVTGTGSLSATEQERVNFKGDLARMEATGASQEERVKHWAAIEHVRRTMHGSEK